MVGDVIYARMTDQLFHVEKRLTNTILRHGKTRVDPNESQMGRWRAARWDRSRREREQPIERSALGVEVRVRPHHPVLA